VAEGERDPAAVPLRRVRKAYEQVADQLRELIVRGELRPGDRLPVESALAREFGVSRATVREALRLLAAQSLVRTEKGATGGSYVTLPTAATISSLVHANVGLLAETRNVTLEELLEARELVEVPAARLAAVRRSEEDLELLRTSVPDDAARLGTREEFTYNAEFHSSCRRSRSSRSCRRTSPARRSGARSTAPSTRTTIGSSPRSRPATRTPPRARCTTTSPSCGRTTRRHGSGPPPGP
jgi:DNA-binding GntR family transcriptional regulator